MSAASASRAHSLDDFVGFLEGAIREGFEVVVIGGCAVGAYAQMMGETTLSADLDLYCTAETLKAVIEWASRHGATIEKRPQPRSVPCAVLSWAGLEVDIVTASHGLPGPQQVARTARLVRLSRHGDLPVAVADPFDLLANKLIVDRPKDRQHAKVLQQFVEEEVVHAFRELSDPRERLAPARRLLEATRSRTLPEALAGRLVTLAVTGTDFKFLMSRVPVASQADALIERVTDHPDIREELLEIRKHRRFR